MSSASTTALFTTMFGEVTAALYGVLPTILTVLGGLIALGLALRYARKFIGKRA